MAHWVAPLPHQSLMALAGILALVGAMGQWGHGADVDASGATVRQLDWNGLEGSLGAATATIAALAVVTALRPARAHTRTLGSAGLFAGILALAFVAVGNGGSPAILDFPLFHERQTDLGWGLWLLVGASLVGLVTGLVAAPSVVRIDKRPASYTGVGTQLFRHPGTRSLFVVFLLIAIAALLPWASGVTRPEEGAASGERYRVLGFETSLGLATLAAALAGLGVVPAKLEARLRSALAAALCAIVLLLAVNFDASDVVLAGGREVGGYAAGPGVVLTLSLAVAGVLVGVYRALPLRVVPREGEWGATRDPAG